jgi:hypothetical protein
VIKKIGNGARRRKKNNFGNSEREDKQIQKEL